MVGVGYTPRLARPHRCCLLSLTLWLWRLGRCGHGRGERGWRRAEARRARARDGRRCAKWSMARRGIVRFDNCDRRFRVGYWKSLDRREIGRGHRWETARRAPSRPADKVGAMANRWPATMPIHPGRRCTGRRAAGWGRGLGGELGGREQDGGWELPIGGRETPYGGNAHLSLSNMGPGSAGVSGCVRLAVSIVPSCSISLRWPSSALPASAPGRAVRLS